MGSYEQYTPGAASGAEVHKDGEQWTLVLIRDLAQGFAGAVEETGKVDAATVAAWRLIERTGAVVGHTDTLALPPEPMIGVSIRRDSVTAVGISVSW